MDKTILPDGDGGSRTHTGFPPEVFETSASAVPPRPPAGECRRLVRTIAAVGADQPAVTPEPGDALVIVDVQGDFVTGSLAVPGGAEVIAPLNRAAEVFAARGLPVIATRDWHPDDHVSFHEQGGPWPPHCVAGTPGADSAEGLELPPGTAIIEKADTPAMDVYSPFAGTELADDLRARGIRRLVVGGLATDYCVLN